MSLKVKTTVRLVVEVVSEYELPEDDWAVNELSGLARSDAVEDLRKLFEDSPEIRIPQTCATEVRIDKLLEPSHPNKDPDGFEARKREVVKKPKKGKAK